MLTVYLRTPDVVLELSPVTDRWWAWWTQDK
jgi:hypothetical protein